MILPDYPIEDKSADALRRAPLAKKVAELIGSFEGKESFVIGIEGVWGSGKTSFINLVTKELENHTGLVFVAFNPWNFSGTNELIADFFASMAGALRDHSANKDLVKTVQSYASRLQVTVSPTISLFGASVKMPELWSTGGQTLQEKRTKIDQALRSFEKKIVVVIDDTDRLDTTETRLIMKLVKMTANFPNTIFLLAYDRAKVAEKLNGEGWSGDEYLKKIVQVSFSLPLPDDQGLQKILFGDLDQTIKSVYGEVQIQGEDEQRWHELGGAGFKTLFKTVRDIKRYISSLRLNWSIVGKEDVNQIDFTAIEAIRVFAPNYYAGMAANASLFVGQHAYASNRDEGTARGARLEELLALAPPEIKAVIKKLTEVLFPIFSRGSHDAASERIWRRDRRVCAAERFGFYFQLGVPEGAISEGEVRELLPLLADKQKFTENILDLFKQKRLRPMLSKFVDRIESLTAVQVQALVLALWDHEKEIREEREEMFDFDDVATQISRLAFQGIKHAFPAPERAKVLRGLLDATVGFYSPVSLISLLRNQHVEGHGGSEPPLITAAELDELEPVIAARIQSKATDGTLIAEDKFVYILFRWQNMDGAEAVREYVKQLVNTRDGLLAFLRGCVGRVLSSNGNYNNIEKAAIGQLYPLEELDALVATITEQEMETLDDASKEAVKLFRKPRGMGWRHDDDD